MDRAAAAQALLVGWSGIEAVDHHCHPLLRWPLALDSAGLRAVFSEALDPRVARDHVPHSASYRAALRRLALELGCGPEEEEILAARAGQDPAAYANRLLERSGTGTMLLDHGFGGTEAFTAAEHRVAIRRPQREVVRLETLAEDLAGEHDTPEGWLAGVRGRLRAAVSEGAVAVKTVAAYRASLRLRPPDRLELAGGFASLRAQARATERPRLAGDVLCHALLIEAAQECLAMDVPLQVHCGLGDPEEDLAEASPLGLRLFFHDPAYAGLKVVLLHCYPYHREAAYLCAVYPDVFMDLSLAIPLAALDGARAMREVLGLCPWSKLLYASDASRLPEAFLVAAVLHREALAAAFGELVEGQALTLGEAVVAGRRVLSDNALHLYRLAGQGC